MHQLVGQHGWVTNFVFLHLDALKQPQNEFHCPKIGLEHFIKYESYTQILKILDVYFQPPSIMKIWDICSVLIP